MCRKILNLSKHLPNVSRIGYGCMGLGGEWNTDTIFDEDVSQAYSAIEAALENGINFFDHADIYRHGKSEKVFGQVLKQSPKLRDNMFIQTKCGIRFKESNLPGRYDFSRKWITQSVEESLRRLNTDYIDVLMLHRPDPLMEPAELAESLMSLKNTGKINHIAVSNMNHYQVSFIQEHLDIPIIANQIEMSLGELDWLNDGVMVGSTHHHKLDFVSGTLEFCQKQGVQLQAWGCLAKGKYSALGLNSDCIVTRRTTELVHQLAQQYTVTPESILTAFLLRHPCNIQPILGTTNIKRIHGAAMALNFELSREDWYCLFVSARGEALP